MLVGRSVAENAAAIGGAAVTGAVLGAVQGIPAERGGINIAVDATVAALAGLGAWFLPGVLSPLATGVGFAALGEGFRQLSVIIRGRRALGQLPPGSQAYHIPSIRALPPLPSTPSFGTRVSRYRRAAL